MIASKLKRRAGNDRLATVEALRERLRTMHQEQAARQGSAAQQWGADQPATTVQLPNTAAPERPAPEPLGLDDVVRGLRAGAVHSIQSRSLALACMGAVLPSGSWGAIVGMPDLGIEAASDLGVPIDRVALVPHPGRSWLDVIASLAEAMPVVLAASPGRVTPTDAARLAARLRLASSTLLIAGAWRGAATTVRSIRAEWRGLAAGDGRITAGSLIVEAASGGALRPLSIPLVYGEGSVVDDSPHSGRLSAFHEPRHAEAA